MSVSGVEEKNGKYVLESGGWPSAHTKKDFSCYNRVSNFVSAALEKTKEPKCAKLPPC